MSWQPLNLASSEFVRPTEPPAWCDLIYRGGVRHAVSGPPEAMKTMFALIAGLEVIRSGGGFALVDFESGPHATRRMLNELGASLDEIKAIHYIDAETGPDDESVAAIIDAGTSLVTVDAAAGAFGVSGLDDNARKDAELFGLLWTDPFWRAGVSTMLLDHVVKNSETRGRFAIGSERKLGRVDVHLGLSAVTQISRGAHGLVKVTTHKDRPGHLARPHAAELHLVSDPVTHGLTWEFRAASEQAGDEWRPTELMGRVSAFLERQGEPVSRNTVEQSIEGKAKYVRQAMDALIGEGWATESPGPNRARLVSSMRLYEPGSSLVPGSSQFVPDELPSGSSLRPPLIGDEDEHDDGQKNEDQQRDELNLGTASLDELQALADQGEL